MRNSNTNTTTTTETEMDVIYAESVIAHKRREPVYLNAGYRPTDWSYIRDQQGRRVYTDHRLNVLQTNLETLNMLIDDVRTRALIDILEIQTNLSTSTIKDPTIQILALVVGKIVEGLAMVVPAGSALAVIVGVSARLISGGIQYASKLESKQGDLQAATNNLRSFVDHSLSDLTDLISEWIANPQANWDKEMECPGSLLPELKGPTTLSHLADYDVYLPQRDIDREYNTLRNSVESQARTQMCKTLLPVRFKVRDIMSYDESDERFLWKASWWETRSTSAYNRWRSCSDFPNTIPGYLADDIDGPFTDIGDYADYKGGRQYYQCFDGGGYPPDRPGRPRHYWTRDPSRRWTGKGGRHCPSSDGGDQGPGCDVQIDDQGNMKQGTAFLDFLDDVLDDAAAGQIDNPHWNKSGFVWHKLVNPRTKEELVNTRKVEALTDINFCNDYQYEKKVFHWNALYRGIRLYMFVLCDNNGDGMADSTADWLFRDNGHGGITNENGLANRLDVFMYWGVPAY